MNLGDILYKLWDSLYGLVPFAVINVWQQGVAVRMGNVRKLLTHDNGFRGTGLHFFIPLLEELHVVDASTAVVPTAAQSLVTADGHTVTCSFISTYNISNYQKLVETIYEQDEIVTMEIQAAAAELVPALTYKEARSALADLVFEALHKKLDAWGINLEEVTLKSLAKCSVHRLIGGAS